MRAYFVTSRLQCRTYRYVHGFNGDANGPNLFLSNEPTRGAALLVFAVAAVVVVHDPAAKTQRFFMRHTDDVVSLAVDASGTLAASGQCSTIEKVLKSFAGEGDIVEAGASLIS